MNQANDWVGRLAESHGRMVLAAAWRVLGRSDDAEDVLQEVFLRLLRMDPATLDVRDWGAYLRVAAVRAAIDQLRRNRQLRHVDPAALERVPDGADRSPTALAERHERAELLRAALARLPEREATLFALRHFEELSYEEIAERLEIPVGRVGVALHRARKRLAALLAPLLRPQAKEIAR